METKRKSLNVAFSLKVLFFFIQRKMSVAVGFVM